APASCGCSVQGIQTSLTSTSAQAGSANPETWSLWRGGATTTSILGAPAGARAPAVIFRTPPPPRRGPALIDPQSNNTVRRPPGVGIRTRNASPNPTSYIRTTTAAPAAALAAPDGSGAGGSGMGVGFGFFRATGVTPLRGGPRSPSAASSA